MGSIYSLKFEFFVLFSRGSLQVIILLVLSFLEHLNENVLGELRIIDILNV